MVPSMMNISKHAATTSMRQPLHLTKKKSIIVASRNTNHRHHQHHQLYASSYSRIGHQKWTHMTLHNNQQQQQHRNVVTKNFMTAKERTTTTAVSTTVQETSSSSRKTMVVTVAPLYFLLCMTMFPTLYSKQMNDNISKKLLNHIST